MRLKALLDRIALQRKEDFPFPEDIESYIEDFIPNHLLKSETLQQAFGITDYEMEKLYEDAYNFYEKNAYQDGLTLFRWLILFNPYAPKYWMGFAAILQLSKAYDKALHAYAVITLLDSNNPYPHFHAYECYSLMENRTEARKALELAYHHCSNQFAYAQLKEEIERIKLEAVIN
ncbi:MAG: SycD/LcrH family type III secretion system chaperone [Chlamydiales bacterium]